MLLRLVALGQVAFLAGADAKRENEAVATSAPTCNATTAYCYVRASSLMQSAAPAALCVRADSQGVCVVAMYRLRRPTHATTSRA